MMYEPLKGFYKALELKGKMLLEQERLAKLRAEGKKTLAGFMQKWRDDMAAKGKK